jgi:hypothetical protein
MKLTVLILASTLMFQSGCSLQGTDRSGQLNEAASIAGDLPFNPLQWKVVASSIDQQASVMSTLFGNDLALRHARSAPATAYPPGSILSLVTWSQREDPHWFGAKIPGPIKSIEFAIVDAGPDQNSSISYQLYEGPALIKNTSIDAGVAKVRIESMMGTRASVMP